MESITQEVRLVQIKRSIGGFDAKVSLTIELTGGEAGRVERIVIRLSVSQLC